MAKERVDRDAKKSKGIGIRLNPGEKDRVNYICNRNELDISDMMRQLINQEYFRLKAEESKDI